MQSPAESAPVGPMRAVRWAFYAFVFSLLFETVPLSIPTELTRITAILLVAVALLQPHVCYRFPPSAFWCFAGYVYVGVTSLVLGSDMTDPTVLWRMFVLLQLLLLFWVSYNLMRYEAVAEGSLLSLSASCVALGVMRLAGRAPAIAYIHSDPERFAAFGLDPNQLAGLLSAGLLALVGLTYGRDRRAALTRWPAWLVWPPIALIASTIMVTGSRGGLLALGVGIMALALRPGPLRVRVRIAGLVVLVAGAVVFAAMQSELLTHRFEKFVDTGSMAARERIYPTALRMFMEKPAIGWGPSANTTELGGRLNLRGYEHMDTHNVLLYALTATGLLGTIPMVVGLWLCVRAAWRARNGRQGIVPFALVASLVAAEMSVSGLNWKQHWVLLAYALASGSPILLAREPDVARADQL